MRLILSTSNIMGNGPSILLRTHAKSNFEFTAALRSNISLYRDSASSYTSWTSRSDDGNDLYIPARRNSAGLAEDRDAYDITVKLFYLPGVAPSQRCQHTRDAIDAVLRELKVESISLLIVSFPDITFDADDESDDTPDDSPASDTPPASASASNDRVGEAPPEAIESILQTWKTLESICDAGLVQNLGLSEFGTHRLSKVLASARIPPTVDQINVRDCCVVPRPLIVFAKQHKIELLTHSDCTDILPRGTLREILGSTDDGCGVLAPRQAAGGAQNSSDGLQGQVEPLWVVKYTAVVINRGVVENKGYIAAAQLQS